MNVRNCRGCGKVFNYVMGPFLCPRCRDEQEVIFQGVKKYVEEQEYEKRRLEREAGIWK